MSDATNDTRGATNIPSVPLPRRTTKYLKKGDPAWEKRRQEVRDELTADFKAGKLGVENGWLVEYVEHCTCAGGTMESNGIHERHCGLDPIQDLIPADAEFIVPEDYDG